MKLQKYIEAVRALPSLVPEDLSVFGFPEIFFQTSNEQLQQSIHPAFTTL